MIVEGDDIHGDGVNIADRMQALAEPGGVAISGTAYDQVKAKLPVGYASLGRAAGQEHRGAGQGLPRAHGPCRSRQDGRPQPGATSWALSALRPQRCSLPRRWTAWWQPWQRPRPRRTQRVVELDWLG